MEYQTFGQLVLSFGVVLPRIAGAFLLLPYFTSDTIPSLLRNIFFVGLALALVPLVLAEPLPPTLTGTALLPLLLKEIFIGVAIGYTFGIVFWAFEGAGQVIDGKVGSTLAQLSDPVTGYSTTLIGAYLGRLAGYFFVAFGGLRVFVDLLLSSFRIWPILSPLPDLAAVGSLFFIQRFDDLMRLMLLLAAPSLCVLTLLDLGLGLINRFAPQFNVFTLSTSIKSWFAVAILLLSVTSMGEFLVRWLGDQGDLLQRLPFHGARAM
jgi:type III secretion protein T